MPTVGHDMSESLPARILIVDDEPDVADSIGLLVESTGGTARVETDPLAVERAIDDFQPHLVLCDLRMPGVDGRRVLETIRHRRSPPHVVMMSAYGSLDTARDALGWGADDFVSKPLSVDDIQRIVGLARTVDDTPGNVAAVTATARFGLLIGDSAAMRNVFRVIERIAPFPTTVLIQGESGVGKELVAREIHARSGRGDGPFVPVNCGAIPETLLESELFGYKRGAFTGADQDRDGLIRQADGGTLFLDEIGDLPLLLQVKLLRVLQEGQVQPLGAAKPVNVDVRWLTATLVDLEAAVNAGKFRQDLYFRLNVLRLDLPPLRERPGDLRVLAGDILQRLNRRYGKNVTGLDAAALALMQVYSWPGNIRELENVLERAYILCDGNVVTAEAIRGLVQLQASSASETVFDSRSLSIKKETERLEIELIRRALAETKGNRTHAAKLLEISHRALLYKLRDYNLS